MADFASDESTGVYFWQHGATQFSTHPHPALEHHCEFHGWWSDGPCLALHGPREWKPEGPLSDPMPMVQVELFEEVA